MTVYVCCAKDLATDDGGTHRMYVALGEILAGGAVETFGKPRVYADQATAEAYVEQHSGMVIIPLEML